MTMKRTLAILLAAALVLPGLTLAGCSKFLPGMRHRTTNSKPAATSSSQQPASQVVHKNDQPAANSTHNPATTPATGANSTTAGHKS
jgi:outer membrane murein-binding lipoprotein Lpp